MVASEESVLHEVLDAPERVWSPRAGEPVIARVRAADETAGAPVEAFTAGVA